MSTTHKRAICTVSDPPFIALHWKHQARNSAGMAFGCFAGPSELEYLTVCTRSADDTVACRPRCPDVMRLLNALAARAEEPSTGELLGSLLCGTDTFAAQNHYAATTASS